VGPQQTPQERLAQARVIAGTCAGVRGNPDVRARRFALAVVEEAGKATPPEALMAMVRARKSILMGDSRQLPPHVWDPLREVLRQPEQLQTTDTDREDEANELRAQIRTLGDTPDARERAGQETLFDHFSERLRGTGSEATLHTQYRMVPEIGELVSRVFYAEAGGLRHARETAVDPRVEAFAKGTRVKPVDVRDRSRGRARANIERRRWRPQSPGRAHAMRVISAIPIQIPVHRIRVTARCLVTGGPVHTAALRLADYWGESPEEITEVLGLAIPRVATLLDDLQRGGEPVEREFVVWVDHARGRVLPYSALSGVAVRPSRYGPITLPIDPPTPSALEDMGLDAGISWDLGLAGRAEVLEILDVVADVRDRSLPHVLRLPDTQLVIATAQDQSAQGGAYTCAIAQHGTVDPQLTGWARSNYAEDLDRLAASSTT
jgi:hypothetical protein